MGFLSSNVPYLASPILTTVQIAVAMWLFARSLPRREGFAWRAVVATCVTVAFVAVMTLLGSSLESLPFVSAGMAWPDIVFVVQLVTFSLVILLCYALVLLLFDASPAAVLFCVSAAYIMQNIASGLDGLMRTLLVPAGAAVDTWGFTLVGMVGLCAAVYAVCYRTIVRKIERYGFSPVKGGSALVVVMMVVLVCLAFDLANKCFLTACGLPTRIVVLYRAVHFATCMFVLWMEFELLYNKHLEQDVAVMQRVRSDEERQYISGYQTSFINGGGIVMSLCGGALAGLVWYGGYLMLLLAVPVAIIALFAIPRVKPRRDQTDKSAGQPREKLHPDVFLYSASIFIFMLIYCVGGSNISTHLAPLGSTALSGVATAIQMAGGVVCGLFFGTLSIKLRDKMMSLAFVAIFVGMMILSLFPDSVVMSFVGMFICGMAMSMMLPQCMFSTSRVVRESNSALATSLTSCIAPGFGGFFSAMVFTNITHALYGDSTVLRYRFVAIVALVMAVLFFLLVTYREKKAAKEN